MKATIIGAGIGGLTTAIALQQRGIEVEIFESTAEFKKVQLQFFRMKGLLSVVNAIMNMDAANNGNSCQQWLKRF